MANVILKSGYSPTRMLSYKVDWLAFTLSLTNLCDYKITIKRILDSWGYDYDHFERGETGRYFYNSSLSIDKYFNIYFNDPEKPISKFSTSTISFQLTGNGCTDLGYKLETILDSNDDEQNWLWLLKWLTGSHINAKITRFDLALDDFKGLCNFELMVQKLKAGYYRSTKKTYSISRGADQKKRSTGMTIYIGKMPKGGAGSKGVYYLRMYKKLDEFREKNQLPPRLPRETGVWDRYEIAFSKKKAVDVVAKIVEEQSFGRVYFGILRGLIEFLNPTRNGNGNLYKNKDNWRVCPWWEKFLQHAEKVQIGSDASRDISLADTLAWLRTSVLPSLRMVEQIGLDHGFDIYEIIKRCDVNFAKKQLRVMKDSKTMPDDLLKLYLKEFEEGYK